MNQEQFGQFWEQLRTPLKDTWAKITMEDLDEIQGDLAKFGSVLQRRYGELHKEEGDHLGRPPVFPLDGKLCRLQRS